MNITITMTAEEFEEFRAWQREKEVFTKELERVKGTPQRIAASLFYGVDPVPGKAGKYKIVDQDHMDDAMQAAEEFMPKTKKATRARC